MALPIAASLMLLIGGTVGYQLKPTSSTDQEFEVAAALTRNRPQTA